MSTALLDAAFTFGEVAPAMFGRFDLARMHSAAATERNMYVGYRGGAYSRAGTAFCGFSKQTGRSVPPKMVPFQFSLNQGLALEFGNFYMRVVSDGGFVTDKTVAISGATQADPAVLGVLATAQAVASATSINTGVTTSYQPNDTVTLAGGSFTTAGVLQLTSTAIASLKLNNPGTPAVAEYAPGDTITLAGGTQTTAPQVQVTTTQVVSGGDITAGTANFFATNVILGGTTGTGTKFRVAVDIDESAGITAVLGITFGGDYTVNPTTSHEPVVIVSGAPGGAVLSGASFNLYMGVLGFVISNPGSFTANPAGSAFTQASTSGSGAGATFNNALFGPGALTVSVPGVYAAAPANPVEQASTSGVGVGAAFDLVYATIDLPTFNTGDWIAISGVEGMTQLNGNTYVVGAVTATTAVLYDVYGNPVNSTAYSAYISGGTAARIFTLTTPYSDVDLDYLKFTQSADVMSLCLVNQETLTEYAPLDLNRLSDDNWTTTPVVPAPTALPPSGATAATSGSGSWDYQYVVTAVSPSDGTESIASNIAEVDSSVDVASTAGVITVTWDISTTEGVGEYYIYKATPSFDSSPPAGTQFGFAGAAYGTQFQDLNIVADFSQVPPQHQNPFARGQILGVKITNPGSAASFMYAVVSVNGSGVVLTPVVVGSELVAVIVDNPGMNYQPGDTISFSEGGAGGVGATATFTASATDGAIETVTVTDGGTGYSNPVIAAPSGTGAVFVPIIVNGVITEIYWSNSGTGYPASGSLTITPGAPGTAAGTLIVGPESGTYPGVPGYFQERRVYAYSLNDPDTYWMSQPGAFTNFDFRVPPIDSDAITGSPWAEEVNGIQFMVNTSGGLLVLTGLSIWLLVGAGSFATNVQAISPSSQLANPQPEIGCSSTVPPVKIDYDVIYLSSKDAVYFDLPYQLYALSTPLDITINSAHMFTGFQIINHAWCREPNKVLWAVRSDGVLLSLTWLKPEQVQGWARHDTQGSFASVCSVTEPPVDALYLAAERNFGSGNAYTIERMDNRIWNNVEDCWCVDCGFSLPQPEPVATLTPSSATGLGSITGVTGLAGGTGYSAATTAAVVDDDGEGPGTGAVPVLTIVAGVITAVTFPLGQQGQKYSYPALVFTDPAGSAGGSGASASPVLNNTMTFAASAAVFSAGSVGSYIRCGGGKAVVTAYTSPTLVTANILIPISQTIPNTGGVPQSFASGDWTLTAPVTSVQAGALAGATVTGLADGKVITPRVVGSDGTIALDHQASQVTVGLGFTAQLQTVYLDTGEPTVQGQRKKISAVTVRIEASLGVEMGTNQIDGSTLSPPQVEVVWNGLTGIPDKGIPAYGDSTVPLYTGDERNTAIGGFATQGQVAVQQVNPLPLNVIAIIPEFWAGDLSEQKFTPPKQRTQR